jgi:large subunit ribosomal protein L9
MARNVEVLLTKNVFKLGRMGDIVKVRPGYARNYLLPGNQAVPAGAAAKRQIEVLKARANEQMGREKALAEGKRKELAGKKVVIPANVSHDDQLFGSVGPRDIVEAFADQGIEVDANAFRMHENFKRLGTYKVAVDLYEDVECEVTVQVVNANPQGPGLDEAIEEEYAEEEQA